MGLDQIGCQLYPLAAASDHIEIAAIADIGKPEILDYILESDTLGGSKHKLQGNYLLNPKCSANVTPAPYRILGTFW